MTSKEEKVWEIYALHPRGRNLPLGKRMLAKQALALKREWRVGNSRVSRFIRSGVWYWEFGGRVN